MIRRESVEVAYRQLGGRVCEVVTSDVCMCPDFMEGCVASRPPPVFKEVYNALDWSHVVVVISRAPGVKVRVVVPDGLEAGEGRDL